MGSPARGLGLGLGLSLALTVGGQADGPKVKTGGKNVATVEITAKQADFKAGEPVELEAALKNAGDKPLWVNKRLLLNSRFVPAPYREISLSVTGPAGEEVRFSCKIRVAEAAADDYTVLPPGEKVTAPMRLDQCFDLAKAGTYKIKAEYGDGNRKVPPAPAGAVHLAGPLTSNEVQIRIQ